MKFFRRLYHLYIYVIHFGIGKIIELRLRSKYIKKYGYAAYASLVSRVNDTYLKNPAIMTPDEIVFAVNSYIGIHHMFKSPNEYEFDGFKKGPLRGFPDWTFSNIYTPFLRYELKYGINLDKGTIKYLDDCDGEAGVTATILKRFASRSIEWLYSFYCQSGRMKVSMDQYGITTCEIKSVTEVNLLGPDTNGMHFEVLVENTGYTKEGKDITFYTIWTYGLYPKMYRYLDKTLVIDSLSLIGQNDVDIKQWFLIQKRVPHNIIVK